MLLRYIVSNFKSIGHSLDFSMLPPKHCDGDLPTKDIETRAGTWKVLRRGGFFGPNASGKSSFVESLAFAKRLVLDGKKPGQGTGIPQFRGELSDLKDRSSFQLMIYVNGDVYDYGFTLNHRQIFDEWLYILTEKEFSPLYVRGTDENGMTNIEVKSRFARKNSKIRKLVDILSTGMTKKSTVLVEIV